jgi:hypothetical protein
MRRLYSTLHQAVVEYWEDRSAVSPQTPFLLTITSGADAAAILRTLAEHHANAATDELLTILVESLQGISKRRARRKRDLLQHVLEQLTDQLGHEAYALTSVCAALTVHIEDVQLGLLPQGSFDAEASRPMGCEQEETTGNRDGLEEEEHHDSSLIRGAPPERVHPQRRE